MEEEPFCDSNLANDVSQVNYQGGTGGGSFGSPSGEYQHKFQRGRSINPSCQVALAPWRTPSLAPQERTIPYMQSHLRPRSPATARWTEGTTGTPRPSARRSTSAPTTATPACPSSPSSAPTALSSSSSTSSANGGSTSTAPPRKTSTG